MNDNKMNLLIKTDNEFLREKYSEFKPKPGDSGLDVFSVEDLTIPAGAVSFKIPLGISAQMIFRGQYAVPFALLPRSSMGLKTPLRLSNSQGVIDAFYSGELCGIVDNLGSYNEELGIMEYRPYHIKKGQRLFQIVAGNLEPFGITLVDSLLKPETGEHRGSDGFGSTGV